MTEDRMRELFREMHDEPVPADSLARVRMAVSARTERRAGWFWRVAAGVALAACALVVVRSSRADHRPPCTMSPSTEIVDGGPPPQPRGDVPSCSVSKVSAVCSSGPGPASWARPGAVSPVHIRIADRKRRMAGIVRLAVNDIRCDS